MATEEQAKARRAESQKEVEKSHAEFAERMKGKPIPSQTEIDLIKLGAPVPHKVGSGAAGPDRSMEARSAGGPTRTTRATTAS